MFYIGSMIDEQKDYIPQKCPVCNGFGTVSYAKVKCHGCDGRGYVVISNTGEPVENKEIDEGKSNSH